MALQVTDITGFADIRAVLGVSEDELEDDTISLPVYAVGLEGELRDLRVSFISEWSAVQAVAAPTDAQEWFLSTASSFATYSVARQLLTALPLLAPKDVTDGKAGLSRFASDPYKVTIDAINAKYAETRGRLQAALEAISPSVTATTAVFRPYYVAGVPVDPVTGV